MKLQMFISPFTVDCEKENDKWHSMVIESLPADDDDNLEVCEKIEINLSKAANIEHFTTNPPPASTTICLGRHEVVFVMNFLKAFLESNVYLKR